MKEKLDVFSKIKAWLFNNMVTILFVVLCAIGIKLSQQPISFVLGELVTRISRNLFLVLSLIIPVLAGMGLNFGIVIGAMAGQIAIIAVTHWKVTGLAGFMLCVLLSTPIAIIFGYFTGKLLNKTKGQEMIASMILGLFANGLYQLLFLFFVGTIIPMKNPVLVLSGGIGIKNTVDLNNGIKYALDGIFELDLLVTALILLGGVILFNVIKIIMAKVKHININVKYIFNIFLAIVVIACSLFIPKFNMALKFVNVPIITLLVIGLVCLFNSFIVKTKLGQDLRTVGQDMHVANASGIKVNKTRIVAIIISTVLAAWGQLIFLQNIGTLNTYGSHEQVGMFAIAALLIGGASVSKATNGQALLGIILFHTLFIISPMAGKNLFDNPQIGEYFRVFIVYGVIGVSLGMYAWKKSIERKRAI
ncbi:simple sugar transport system permease protein [Clostridium amylolyticum]|uniref:Simple sugar transport system permease protein n=1 Tax=Clostridium amylolyticum TaxID=1121298 RepID=A0A1M6IDJ8_9CLOT|nr:ABC transporter permease [Clostridium amylolyticum]SHJ32509.1 simple sugar transport system permease protein [Clostridium amylolyticum]